MRTYDEIFEIAAKRKGGADALNALLTRPKIPAELESVSDDRWLACMTKCIFQAGFNLKVVENMWPGFETAFHGFDIGRCAMLNDDDFSDLVSNYLMRKNICYETDIKKTFLCFPVGYITYPKLIGPDGYKIPYHVGIFT